MPQTIITLPVGTALADGRVLTAPLDIPLPYVKAAIMGRPGGGKSKLAASFPKPMLVLASDPFEKLQPYHDQGLAGPTEQGQFGQARTILTSPKTKKPVIQLEHFYDLEPGNPQATNQFLSRTEQLRAEVPVVGWSTIVIDSWTLVETFAKWRRRTGVFAVKDGDMFGRDAGAAKDDLWPILVSRLMPLQANVVVVFHTTEKAQSGEGGGPAIYGIKAIGTLPGDIAGLMPERWRCEAQSDGTRRLLYTRPDGRFDLTTLFDIPQPCENTYGPAMWSNYINRRAAMLAPPTTAADVTAAPAPAGEGEGVSK